MSAALASRRGSSLWVQAIATLFPMNLDAIATLWLMRRFGLGKYNGISTAKLLFWPGGNKTPDGRPAEEWEADRGVYAINCGGGSLDHHPHSEYPNDCTFTLLLRQLGLYDDPRFASLKKYILWDDTRNEARGKNPSEELPLREETDAVLARIIKDLQETVELSGDPAADEEIMRAVIEDRVLPWAFCALDYMFERQKTFFGSGAEAFENAEKIKVNDSLGREWCLVVGHTKSTQFARYARSKHGCQASIVIQFQPNGHVQIIPNIRCNLNVVGLIRLVRLEEARVRGRKLDASDPELGCDGSHPDVPQWYAMLKRSDDGSSLLFNGSLRHRAVEPTKIAADRLKELVVDWLTAIPKG